MTCTSRIVAASLGACVGVIAVVVAGVVLGVVALEQLRRMGR